MYIKSILFDAGADDCATGVLRNIACISVQIA